MKKQFYKNRKRPREEPIHGEFLATGSATINLLCERIRARFHVSLWLSRRCNAARDRMRCENFSRDGFTFETKLSLGAAAYEIARARNSKRQRRAGLRATTARSGSLQWKQPRSIIVTSVPRNRSRKKCGSKIAYQTAPRNRICQAAQMCKNTRSEEMHCKRETHMRI